jgi:hypothetical protein
MTTTVTSSQGKIENHSASLLASDCDLAVNF